MSSGKNFASPPPPSFSHKLEREREKKSRGGTEKNGEAMEKEGKTGGRLCERQGVASSREITCGR